MWIILTQSLAIALYIVGFILFIRACRRYQLQIVWILAGLAGPFLYFWLHERARKAYLANTNATAELIDLANNRVKASLWYVVLAYLLIIGVTSYFYYTIMDGAGALEAMMLQQQTQTISLMILSVIYGAVIYYYHKQAASK